MDLKNIKFNKRYGQNFITDTNLLKAIVIDSGIGAEDVVLEIGAGAGTLTAQIAQSAKKVIAYEIDDNLKPILDKTLQGLDNVEVIYGDFLKRKSNLESNYKVVANLPYYITTPVIFELLENSRLPESITIMVQKEVAERLTALPDTESYGAVTAAVDFFGTARIMRIVKREMFTPVPGVDSAVVRIDIEEKYPHNAYRKFSRTVKAAFAMRRKTLANNLSAAFGMTKAQAGEALAACGIPLLCRGETLSTDKFYLLSQIL